MIACISPSDCDYVETLNTLKYANRAKDIKNKIVANQDKSSKLIGCLRSRIAELEAELLDFKQGRITVSDGIESFNDQYRENVLLQADVSQLRIRVKALQETVEMLRARNVQLLAEKVEVCARMSISESQNQHVFIESTRNKTGEHEGDAFGSTVRVYLDELESLRCALMESHATNEQLHQQVNRWKAMVANNTKRMPVDDLANHAAIINDSLSNNAEGVLISTPIFSLIQEAKADIKRMKQNITGNSLEEEKTNHDETKIYTDNVLKSSMMMDDFDVDAAEEVRDEDDEDIEIENEAETECFKLRDDLADLQAEISIKERLVSELEQSERRLAEKKLEELSLRINEMEIERDRVLAEIASKHSQKVVDAEQVRRIREDYEKKLTAMRDEFRKLQSVEREHRRMQAKQVAEQQQLLRLRNELNELKKTKVQLMQRIKEEARRAKAIELANMKKLAGLEKESRKKDNLIQKLQNKDRQREDFLKRSTDERSTYDRKNERNGTQRSVRSAPLRHGRGTVPLTKLEVNKAKTKWMAIEKNIRRRISQRQAITKMEDELEKIVAEKRILAEEIQRLEQQFIKANDLAERDLIGEHIDGCYAKMRYVQEQFTELRNTIAGIDNENIKVNLFYKSFTS
ncbi:unnamed protein product [Onchocerca flexuosa]|uniref:Kinesin motor domain-containing protein n=1 Tax=Onchocerca flexuosa TaxID=387005 RepID=A0A183H2J0_9BILA|nr:unnamed protein product [Onchocerca flexuosa]